MPLVKDAPPRKTKSFVKKEYRPWDLFGEKDVTINANRPDKEVIAKQGTFVKTPFRPSHSDVFEEIVPPWEKPQPITSSPVRIQSTNKIEPPSSSLIPTIENETDNGLLPIDTLNNKSLGNHKGTIREPLGDTIREPLGSDQGAIREQMSSSVNAEKPHQGTIRGRNREQHQGTIRGPLGDGIGDKKYLVSQLTGVQKSILFYIVESCVFRGQLTSNYLTNETLRCIANTTSESVKTTIKRLVSKGFIHREGGKPGNGGGASFSITSLLRDEVLNEKRYSSIREPLGDGLGNRIREPLGNNQGTDQGTSPSSSSSSLILKETTTTEGWGFDITPYEKFGFRQSHLKQLAQLKIISAADVERSLIEFNFDLENNLLPPIRTGKINLLMGLFRQGNTYLSENYKSEQEAMAELMAERAKKKRQQALEEQFIVWEANLDEQEREKIVKQMPPHLMVLNCTGGIDHPEIKKCYMAYFVDQGKKLVK